MLTTTSCIDLYQVDVGLLQTTANVGQRLFAIGDLNNDKQNDIITVNEEMNAFSAHYFKSENYRFASNISKTIMPEGFKII